MSRADMLLVEDSQSDLELTMRALRRGALPFDVAVARDGCEAARRLGLDEAAAAAALPALVLLDLHLPKVDGLELLRRLRAEPRTAGLPVIVLAGPEHPDAVAALALGANAAVAKPVDVGSLQAALSTLGLALEPGSS